MGLFKRLHRITVGRIEAFLKSVEDPEILFPQLVKEMEDQLREATAAEAQALAAAKSAQRDIEQLQARLDRLHKGAVAAVRASDDTTAREALAAELEIERSLAAAQDNMSRVQGASDRATAAREMIQQQLAQLRAKKNEILTRARVAKAQKKVQKTVGGAVGSSDSILDAVARLETSIEQTEAELEIQSRLQGETASPSLEKRLADLDRTSEVERRLATLRQQASPPASPGA
jgi:phage shock protein A